MKAFMNENFLLQNRTAEQLYHDCAETLPIIDYHCHISPKEIADNRKFQNMTELWLSADHYKWRYLRSCGIDESFITGSADPKDKFLIWAEVLGKAVGNPLYHWSHLELQRYFHFNKPLNKSTAEEAWEVCNSMLSDSSMSAQGLIKQSNVKVICTTDDPVDLLQYHEMIARDKSFNTFVYPAFRPDKALSPEKDTYLEYIDKLSKVTNQTIHTLDDLKSSLSIAMDRFDKNGCVLSDHGLDFIPCVQASDSEIAHIFLKRMENLPLTVEEIYKFKTAMLFYVCSEYVKRNWVLQLHYGCQRDNNESAFQKLGPDTGFDCILNDYAGKDLAAFLNALNLRSTLPKTILYSLNPNDNAAIDTLIGCFQDSSAVSKIQHGSAWWFNDNQFGIKDQLTSLASLGYLPGFVGMLTDSRSFLSYTRHEYFRRILCNLIGSWVENGEFDNDPDTLSEIITDICYNNAFRYFNFR